MPTGDDLALRPKDGILALAGRRAALIFDMSARVYKLRYAGSYLGIVWSVLGPLASALVTATIFSFLIGGQMGARYAAIPYGVFYFSAFSMWSLLSEVPTRCTTTIIEHAGIITKISFPTPILPVVVLVTSLVNYAVFLALAVVLMVIDRTPVSPHLYMLPVYFAIGAVLSVGVGYFLAAIGVFVRDIAQGMPILLNVLFFTVPITYSPDLLRQGAPKWASTLLLDWNPLSRLAEGYRTSLVDIGAPIDTQGLILLAVLAAAVLGAGYASFRALQPAFADVL